MATAVDEALLDLPFDQFQRYRLIADLARRVRGVGRLDVLDVGGRTAVLRRFLPEDRVTLVDVEPSDAEGLVLGTGDRLPFADASFDLVVASDTLEHVPPDRREAFAHECCRVTRRWAVLAGPYQHPRIAEAEELLQDFLAARVGERHRYLEEHRALGLPDRARVEEWCRAAGAREVASVGHGNLERWLGLMCLALYLDADAPLRPAATRLHRFYNGLLYDGDRRGLLYRHAVVAAFGDAPMPAADEVLAPAEVPAAALAPLGHLLTELAAFDRERDVVVDERRRLEGEIARVLADLHGHAERVAECEEDLAGHRGTLETTRAELERHRAALAATTADLEGHRETLGAARHELEATRLVVADLERDLEGHRAVVGEQRVELEALRAENEAVRRHAEERVAAHVAEEASLRAEIETVRSEARAIEAELLRKTRWRRRFWKLLGRD